MTRQVLLLAACQAMLMSGTSYILTTSALVGTALAADPRLATLPLALQFILMTVSALPASLLMRRFGRRTAFVLGNAIAIVGALTASQAIMQHDFVLFCLSSAAFGVFHAVGGFYRFAAAEVADESFRAKAISLVLAGGVVAAFIGPNLANVSRDWIDGAAFAGGYAALVVFYALSLIALSWVRVPAMTIAAVAGGGRGMRRIISQPRFIVAVASGMIGYGVMNIIMTSTPLAMDHHGHGIGETAFVIQWHVLGMFVPSFFTGYLISRFGVETVMIAGGLFLAACLPMNLTGVTVGHFWLALILLGIGWNFLFIGATYMVTDCCSPEERAKTQGVNDLLVFGTVSFTALGSGAVHNALGWDWVNLVAAPFILFALAANIWLKVRGARYGVAVSTP